MKINPRKLAVELLEDRCVPAGNSVLLQNGVLSIAVDPTRAHVAVVSNPMAGTTQVVLDNTTFNFDAPVSLLNYKGGERGDKFTNLTSLAGSLILVCATLMLVHHYKLLDAPVWCAQSAGLVNGIVGTLALLGLAIQFLLDRYSFRKKAKEKSWLADLLGVRAAPPPSPSKPPVVKKAA